MSSDEFDEMLRGVDLPEFEPSSEYVERTWGELESLLRSQPAATPVVSDETTDTIDLDTAQTPPPARGRVHRALLAAAAVALVVVGAVQVFGRSEPDETPAAVEVVHPEIACAELRTSVNLGLLDSEVLELATVEEIRGYVAAIDRLPESVDSEVYASQLRWLSNLAGSLDLAARQLEQGNRGGFESTLRVVQSRFLSPDNYEEQLGGTPFENCLGPPLPLLG